MNITTYYNNFSVKLFSELDKTVIFSKKIEDRTEFYMKTEIVVSLGKNEYNCVNIRTGHYSYTAPDEVIFVPSAELIINW